MSVTPFEFEGRAFRFVGEDVVASDLAAALGYASAKDMTRTLDDDEKGGQTVPTPGGSQQMATVTESGFYRACLNRQAGYIKDPAARDFVKRLQRWVTHEVLPAIRKTGSYSVTPALTEDQIIAQALQLTTARVEKLTARLAIAEPKAHAWDDWLSSNVHYSVDQVAKALAKLGALMGRNRLFEYMDRHRWIFRTTSARGSWMPYQDQIETGRLSVQLGSQLNTRTGETFATSTVRITPKGAAKLAQLHGFLPDDIAAALDGQESGAA